MAPLPFLEDRRKVLANSVWQNLKRMGLQESEAHPLNFARYLATTIGVDEGPPIGRVPAPVFPGTTLVFVPIAVAVVTGRGLG
jgi:hypothetical protein